MFFSQQMMLLCVFSSVAAAVPVEGLGDETCLLQIDPPRQVSDFESFISGASVEDNRVYSELTSATWMIEPPRQVPEFDSFVEEQNRVYTAGTTEYEMRRGLYEKRVHGIHAHNSNPYRRWNAVVNHLTDQTDDELAKLTGLGPIPAKKKSAGLIGAHKPVNLLSSQVKNAIVPDDVSWATLSAVTESVDQLSCGSCWAIATSIMLQANAEIKGRGRTFSAQELVDCTPNPHSCGGTGGCSGATVELGMNWIMDMGLDTRGGTPYTGQDMGCKKDSNPAAELLQLDDMIAIGYHPAVSKAQPGFKNLGLKGWERLPENEYLPIVEAVATHGPLAIAVGADGWQSYGDGIFDSCAKDLVLDHAVTLIGYGLDTASNTKYWHIKNSWSNSWGDNGQIKLLRHEGNVHCGTDNKPKEGNACKDTAQYPDTGGFPPSVHVCGMCGILYDAVAVHM